MKTRVYASCARATMMDVVSCLCRFEQTYFALVCVHKRTYISLYVHTPSVPTTKRARSTQQHQPPFSRVDIPLTEVHRYHSNVCTWQTAALPIYKRTHKYNMMCAIYVCMYRQHIIMIIFPSFLYCRASSAPACVIYTQQHAGMNTEYTA